MTAKYISTTVVGREIRDWYKASDGYIYARTTPGNLILYTDGTPMDEDDPRTILVRQEIGDR